MTTISELITQAYRETNLIAVGTVETEEEQLEGLRLINRMIASLFGQEAGELLSAFNYRHPHHDYDEFFPRNIENTLFPQNRRIMVHDDSPRSIKLPTLPSNGARVGAIDIDSDFGNNPFTIDGNGRLIEGQDSITITEPGFNGTWFYRDDLAEWKKLSTLALEDESPFPEEFDDMLSIGLASRLAPRNGNALHPESGGTYTRLLKKFKSMYTQTSNVPTNLALLRTPGVWWTRGYIYGG